jgi:hypothetical protein
MLLNNRARRLGDFASGTIVIREGPRSLATLVAPTTTDHARGVAVSNVDASLVRDFLTRRGTLHAAPRAELAGRLAAAMSQRYGVPVDRDSEQFLEQLVN